MQPAAGRSVATRAREKSLRFMAVVSEIRRWKGPDRVPFSHGAHWRQAELFFFLGSNNDADGLKCVAAAGHSPHPADLDKEFLVGFFELGLVFLDEPVALGFVRGLHGRGQLLN